MFTDINKETKYAVIMANGFFPSNDILTDIIHNSNFILCADGGAKKAHELSIKPNVILGDLDSINEDTLSYFRDLRIPIVKKSSQNINDLEKAIIYLIENGHEKIVLTGISGGRDDHSFTVFQLLKKYNTEVNIIVYSENSKIFLLNNGQHKITSIKNQTISLFPFPIAEDIYTEGLKYPLNHEPLKEGSNGLSNVALENSIKIKIGSGNLLVFINMKL